MPRAEIPEGVERYALFQRPPLSLPEMEPFDSGEWIRFQDLPAIKAHWLEQLKEELLGKRVQHAAWASIEELDGHPPVSSPVLAMAFRAALDSIPIEEGGDE